MNLLAFDTSTEALFVAVQGGIGTSGQLQYSAVGGAQASARLIGATQDLLKQAGLRLNDLEAIVFGRGPGSFTGLRTACAVAQGLAFAANVPVLPVDTLLAVAEEARAHHGVEHIVAMLDARMGEVYSAHYSYAAGHWQRLGEFNLGPPESVSVPPNWVLAGNALSYEQRLPSAAFIEAQPTAQALLQLAPALIASGQLQPAASVLPLYIRNKVAQTVEERAVLRAASLKP